MARIGWADASATYFFYDGNLQRYAMVISGTATYFLWDGPNLLQELNADGTVKEEHTNVKTPIAGIAQLVETNRPGQTQQKIYPVMDPRGTITKWIQSDGSTVFSAREYDAFGNLIPNSASGTWPGRFGYQGQTWQEIFSNNGNQRLLLSRTRLYDPVTGSFLQKDPYSRSPGRSHALAVLNRRASLYAQYVYASSNPTRFVDPLGLDDEALPTSLSQDYSPDTSGGPQGFVDMNGNPLPTGSSGTDSCSTQDSSTSSNNNWWNTVLSNQVNQYPNQSNLPSVPSSFYQVPPRDFRDAGFHRRGGRGCL